MMTHLNVVTAVKSVSVVIDDNEDLGVDNVRNCALASRRPLRLDLVFGRTPVAFLQTIRFHVRKVTESLVQFVIAVALENDMMGASIVGLRHFQRNRPNHQLMADASFLHERNRLTSVGIAQLLGLANGSIKGTRLLHH